MVNYPRDGRAILERFAIAAVLAALLLVTACSPIPKQYRDELETNQQRLAQRLRQEDDARRLARLGRFDEAQRMAQEIEQQEQARVLRCEETWRLEEEMKSLRDQGRHREANQLFQQRRRLNSECNERPRSVRRQKDTKNIESARRRTQLDAVGGREPLYVRVVALTISDSDWAGWAGLSPEERGSLFVQVSNAQANGDLGEVEVNLKRVLAQVQQTRGLADPAASFVMGSLSWVAEKQNRLPEALRYIESAIALVEQSQGRNAKMLSPLLQGHAELLMRSGNARRGLEVGERAFALHADAPESSFEHAAALHNLGVVFHHHGDTQRALDAYRKSLGTLRQIREKATLEQRTMVDWRMPSMLSNIGLALWQRGDVMLAAQYFSQAQEAVLEEDNANRAETEAGALTRASRLAIELDALISLDRAGRISGSLGEASALPMLLERKGAVLERQKRDIQDFRQGARGDPSAAPTSRNSASKSNSFGFGGALDEQLARLQDLGRAIQGETNATQQGEDRELLTEYEAVRAKRAALALNQPNTPQEAATQGEAAAALDTQIKAMDLEIAGRRTMREHFAAMNLPEAKALQEATEAGRANALDQWRSAQQALTRKRRQAMLGEIQARLPANTVLLEMVRYRPLDPRAGLTDEQRWGPARYGTYVIQATGEPRYIDYGDAQSIDQLIGAFRKSLSRPREGEPIELGRRLDAILLQPVREQIGALSQVFIAPEGMLNLLPFGALVDERNRYLVKTHSFNYLTSARDLLQLENRTPGGTAPLIMADPAFDGEGEGAATASLAQGERSRDFSGIKFDRLPATGIEGQIIKQVLPDAVLLTGARATETALKQARGPRILHIATHGFFLEDLNASSETAARRQAHITENPMLRSGLALAGANMLRSASDDGVLTALEAAALDLNGTKLVVLSACETGVGEIKNGEGVFGLRRAFMVAGAETVVMSLWPVADDATKDLMTNYYRRLTQGTGRAEALRQAQLELQQNPKRRHPFYWASFISSGLSGAIK